ncbi:MAG: DUF2520 domain-containing protein [Lacibacter sp.]
MNIVILGSGNTATVLAKMMHVAGHSIVQVWSRNQEHAAELAKQVQSKAIHSLQEITTDADLCMIAVSDKAISEVAAELKLKKKVLVHTAGSVSMEVLKNASPNYGVLYPLQSLRKEMTDLPAVPFLIDGNSDDVKALLKDFALSLSDKVEVANDDARLQMHLAAVITSNFTNHLYAVTEEFCQKRQLDFNLLHPLIQEVANRLNQGRAIDMQTGPARRGDDETIQKHLHILKADEHLHDLYQLLSESIHHLYHKK